jgi:hypothetical protein
MSPADIDRTFKLICNGSFRGIKGPLIASNVKNISSLKYHPKI